MKVLDVKDSTFSFLTQESELPGQCSVEEAAGWLEDSTRVHRGRTLDKPAGPSLSATKRKTHNQYHIHEIITNVFLISSPDTKDGISVRKKSPSFCPPHPALSAGSPCWSGLGEACSRSCRGRGICWFVRRPVGLGSPAPGRWTPAWREAARRQDQPQPARLHPAPLLPPHRTRAGRTPEWRNDKTGGMC